MERRVPLVAAVLFAVFSIFAAVVAPRGPGAGRPGADIVAHLAAHAGMIRLQTLFAALALLALAVVAGYVRDRLDGPAGHLFTVGAVAVVVQVGVQLWIIGGLALHAGDLDPGSASTLTAIAAMWGPVLSVAALLVAGPVIWAARQGRFPRWMAVVAAVFGVQQSVGMLTLIGPVGSFIAPGGPMNAVVGGALFVVFFGALGLAVGLPEGAPAAGAVAGSGPAGPRIGTEPAI